MKPSGFICAYVRDGLAMGTSRVFAKTSPNPKQSANMGNPLRNDPKWAELPLNTIGFTIQGKPLASDSPAGSRPLDLALEGGWW